MTNMKQEPVRLSQPYESALRKHLKQGLQVQPSGVVPRKPLEDSRNRDARSSRRKQTAVVRDGAKRTASLAIPNRNTKSKSNPNPARRTKISAPASELAPRVLTARDTYPVIAMAASGGGLAALSVILSHLPADFPAAIAIVMHLSPDHKSILAEILAGRTDLKVKQAQTGDMLCPSCVFVAPPNQHLLVAGDGRLKLSSSAAEKIHYARPSAEPLFASVAAVYKKKAIAVVLTGGDGDGSFGVQIIKDNGGQVIAQDRPTSQDFSMPETSIKTGDVDFILPLDKIAPKLIQLVAAGGGVPSQKTQRRSKRRGRRVTASAKIVTRHYSARAKAATILRKK